MPNISVSDLESRLQVATNISAMFHAILKIFLIFFIVFFMKSFDNFGEKIFISFVSQSVTLPSDRRPHKSIFRDSIEESSAHTRKSVFNPTRSLFSMVGVKQMNSFPDSFTFGVATSAYQIEGAWNKDGKSESTWDNYVHTHPELITDGANADVGSDSYHLYRDDIDAVNHVGVCCR